MIKDGIEFKECDKCGKLCAKLEMVNWKTCKECVISELEAKVEKLKELEKENAELKEKIRLMNEQEARDIRTRFPC